MSYYRYGGAYVEQRPALDERLVAAENLNRFDPAKYTIGVVTNSGTNASQISCIITDFIPCAAGQIVSCGCIKKETHNPYYKAEFEQGCYGISFFVDTESNRFASASASATGAVVPEGANFVRVSFAPMGYYYPLQTPEIFFVTVADKVTSNPHRYGIKADYVELAKHPWYGKRWVLFGDSFTDSWGGHSWDAVSISAKWQGGTVSDNVPWEGQLFASRIASEIGLTLDNRGRSGSNMCNETGTNYSTVTGIIMLDAFLAEIDAGAEPPALITIAFGANAYNGQVTREDKTALNDYYGATHYFAQKIREKCPGTAFGFVLPYDCNGVHGTKGIGRLRIIEALSDAEYSDIPVCDMLTESGITLADLPDGLHPGSERANTLYCNALRAFVQGIYQMSRI